MKLLRKTCKAKKKITKSEAAAGNLRMACAQVLIDHELLVAFARPKQFFLVHFKDQGQSNKSADSHQNRARAHKSN